MASRTSERKKLQNAVSHLHIEAERLYARVLERCPAAYHEGERIADDDFAGQAWFRAVETAFNLLDALDDILTEMKPQNRLGMCAFER